MNKYLEKIALHQEPVGEILNDHDERFYEIEDELDNHIDDFDHVVGLYSHGAPEDPYRDRLVDHLREVRRDKLRDDLDIDEKHHENTLFTAKRLMGLRNMEHLVNDGNADTIVSRFVQAHGSHDGNPSSVWKGLGTVAATAGGAVLGGALVAKNVGHSPWVLGGAVAGALAGGKVGHSILGDLLNNKIEARHAANYDARESAIESAFDRLKARYSMGH